jgi:hypothetical protein
MPKVKQFADCRIAVNPRDHRPAHVHVEFRDGDRCTVEIVSLKVVGSVRPTSKLRQALEWIADNRESLLALWKEIVQ